MEISPENQEEILQLEKRINIALEIGASILGMDDAFDGVESRRQLNQRLFEEQRDLADGVMALQGRLFHLFLDNPVRHHGRTED